MDRVPILRLGDCLLVTVQVDMHDELALALQDDLTSKIVATRARGVLIDISALEMGGLVHRPHARQHRGFIAHPGRANPWW